MTREVRWTDEAELDLDEIFYFIAFERQDIASARQLVTEIRNKAEAYARQPGMGTLHEEVEVIGEGECVRGFRVHSHVAFYQESETGILILRVLHGRRDYRSLI